MSKANQRYKLSNSKPNTIFSAAHKAKFEALEKFRVIPSSPYKASANDIKNCPQENKITKKIGVWFPLPMKSQNGNEMLAIRYETTNFAEECEKRKTHRFRAKADFSFSYITVFLLDAR